MKLRPSHPTCARYTIAHLLWIGLMFCSFSCKPGSASAMRRASTPPKPPAIAGGTAAVTAQGVNQAAEGTPALVTTRSADAKRAEQKADNTSTTRPHGTASRNPLSKEEARKKYFPLMADVETYIAFVNEEIASGKNRIAITYPAIDQLHVLEQTDEEYKAAKTIFDRELEQFRHETSKLVRAECNVDQYLKFLLHYRRTKLHDRNSRIKKFLEGHDDMLLPLDEQLYKMLINRSYCKKEATRRQNDAIRENTVKKYEFFNWLIRSTYQKCNPDELSRETVDLLRAAVQLHPILEGTSTAMGHADEHTFFALLKQLLAPYFKKHPDPEQWNSRIRKTIARECCASEKWESLYRRFFEEYEKTICNKNRGLAMLLTSMIETEDLAYDLDGGQRGLRHRIKRASEDLEASISIDGVKRLSFMGLGADQKKGANQYVEVEARKLLPNWPLPEPTAEKPPKRRKRIRRKRNKQLVAISHASQLSTSGESSAVVPQAVPDVATATPTTADRTPHVSTTTQEEQKATTPTPTIVINHLPHIVATPAAAHNALPPDLASESEEETEKDVTADFPKGWLPPRALREFHDCMFENAYPAGTFELRQRQQAIVDKLFDRATMCAVPFQQIKRLVENPAIGATIRSSGGSTHYEIIDPEGNVIPGGICYHGDNTTYGKESVRIIQAQLLYLGLRPTHR